MGFTVNGNGGYPSQHDQQHLYRGGGPLHAHLTSSSANSTPRRYDPASLFANQVRCPR